MSTRVVARADRAVAPLRRHHRRAVLLVAGRPRRPRWLSTGDSIGFLRQSSPPPPVLLPQSSSPSTAPPPLTSSTPYCRHQKWFTTGLLDRHRVFFPGSFAEDVKC
ncbi:Os06g0545850 [Oryza sativa Japonica Group]|uniref:Os06g0545850 protein n=1 Tax=Oryza sativa subsp. japonica TaxID=39947 RepID=A0A0P0WXT0_ORYSJ|nr:Os06g0545850 [Oryza sativa Japonica Group]